jgi:hypothetical protein
MLSGGASRRGTRFAAHPPVAERPLDAPALGRELASDLQPLLLAKIGR